MVYINLDKRGYKSRKSVLGEQKYYLANQYSYVQVAMTVLSSMETKNREYKPLESIYFKEAGSGQTEKNLRRIKYETHEKNIQRAISSGNGLYHGDMAVRACKGGKICMGLY